MTGEKVVDLLDSSIDNSDVTNSAPDTSGQGLGSTAGTGDVKLGTSENSNIPSNVYFPSFFSFNLPWNFQDMPLSDSYYSTRIANPTEQFKFMPNWPLGFSSDRQQLSSTTTEHSAIAEVDPISLVDGNLSSSLIPKPGSDHNATTHPPASQEQLQHTMVSHHLQCSFSRSTLNPEYAIMENGTSNMKPNTDDTLRSRKRKAAAIFDGNKNEDQDGGSNPNKRIYHNTVEKRYRAKLNDEITRLRDNVPSLRAVSKTTRRRNITQDRGGVHGFCGTNKLNKATVISKATEYIQHLETLCSQLSDQNNAMQEKLSTSKNYPFLGS